MDLFFKQFFLSRAVIDTYKKNFLLDIIILFSCRNRMLYRLLLVKMSVKKRSVQMRVIIGEKIFIAFATFFLYIKHKY